MRPWSMLLVVGAMACGEDAGAPDAQRVPDPLLVVGGYRLAITNEFAWFPGPRVALEPDGSFVGHDYETLWDCEGQFTAPEQEALTDALNAASILSREDNPQPCADHPIYDFSIEALSGEAAGRRNTFRYERCEGTEPALDAVLGLALAPVQLVQATGTCDACAPETAERACYEDRPYGNRRVCARGTARDCDDGSAGDLVDCGYEALECDATRGWVPGTRWAVREPHVWRWVNDLGELMVLLEWTLELENVTPPGGDALSGLLTHFRIEDPATGEELPFTLPDRAGLGHGWIKTSPALIPMTLNGPAATGAIRTLSAIQVRLRERPWDALPFGEPILAPITNAPPK